MEAFARTIAAELERRGLEVLAAPVCRVREEFAAAVTRFEREGAEAIVTLHLAYSPSLESADVAGPHRPAGAWCWTPPPPSATAPPRTRTS